MKPRTFADGIPVYCAHDEIVDLVKLIPNPRNPNHHPESQVKLGARIIKGNGWRNPIVVSKRSGFITKGHGRLLFAQELGVTCAPVDYQEYENEAAEWADVMADNHLPELSEIDLTEVKALLDEIEDIDIDLTGYDIDKLLEELGESNGTEEDNYEQDDDVKTDIQVGQLFKLGDHCLLCGDATNSQHLDLLMGGKKAQMVFTDPPYDLEDYTFVISIEKYSENAYVFVMCDDQQVQGVLKQTNLNLQRFFILNTYKRVAGTDAYINHILLMRLRNGKPIPFKNLHDSFQTIIKMDYRKFLEKSEGELVHPHQKPIDLIGKFINHFSNPGFIVLDLFGGSGSTLIACEQLGRCGYLMELEPKYCQTIINRWEQFTGKKAERLK